MTVREVIMALERAPKDGNVAVECEHMGENEDGMIEFSMSVSVNGDAVISWIEEE